MKKIGTIDKNYKKQSYLSFSNEFQSAERSTLSLTANVETTDARPEDLHIENVANVPEKNKANALHKDPKLNSQYPP